MYLFDYILLQVANLSCGLQTKHQDLSLISSLVDATLNHLMMLYCLQKIGFFAGEKLKAATGIEVTHLDICSFQERVSKPFIRLIKDNISSRFRSSSKDVLSAFNIFVQRKCPASLLMSYLYMDTVQFKISLDSLGEIYQLKHWKELN